MATDIRKVFIEATKKIFLFTAKCFAFYSWINSWPLEICAKLEGYQQMMIKLFGWNKIRNAFSYHNHDQIIFLEKKKMDF